MYRIVRITAALLCALVAYGQGLLTPPPGKLSVLVFLLTDCPISKRFAPEIGRICTDFAPRGVSCALVFVDPDTAPAQAREYLKSFSLDAFPFVVDARHQLIHKAGATVTPETAVFDSKSTLLYRGRIDDSHVSWTRSRPATRHDLRDALDAALAGRPIAHPRTDAVGCYISPLPDDSPKD